MRTIKPIVLAGLMGMFACNSKNAVIKLNADNVLNTHANNVGTWINSTCDVYDTNFVKVLKELNTKSIRHGWQYTIMDANNSDIFHMIPNDPEVQAYIGDGNGKVKESIVLSEIEKLTDSLGAVGFGILSTDAVNYTGTADKRLAAMNKEARENLIIENAIHWAKWAKTSRFSYFEIGNENDLPADMVNKKLGNKWKPEEYGKLACRIAIAIKKVYPSAKCGVNGGFWETPELRIKWWKGIVTGAPQINDYIDFVVLHKYAFEIDYKTWSTNNWEYGRSLPDNIEDIKNYFPGKPVCITEISGFKTEEGFVPHYRGIITCEMLGNVFSDSIIHHIQHWPTRWEDFGALDQHSTTLNALGMGLAAYTKFAKPVMTSNGVHGKLRYFMAKDPKDNTLTLWLVNREVKPVVCNIEIENFNCTTQNEHWKLVSPNDNPMDTINNLILQEPLNVKQKCKKAEFTVNVNASSVSIVRFIK